ncbi:MAG TPA: alpha/beta fold hydrolase [Stellaceae bacterium]|nr:alpha/beta fold hydrolase [Stellaceae bacterium]
MPRREAASTPLIALAAMLGIGALGALVWRNRRESRRAERRHPARGSFIAVEGTRLHYLERGSGAPVVLLHGNGAMAEDFVASGLMDRLAATYRVIAIDRPGFGYSARPRGRLWTARRQAALIGKALAALGITRPVVVGHSWGALVALEIALNQPLAVAGLVLLAGYFFPTARLDVALAVPNATPLIGDGLNHTLAPPLWRALAPRLIRKVFAPSPVPERFARGFPLDLALRPKQLQSAAHDTALLIAAAATAQRRLGDLTVPTAIIAGDGDAIVETAAQSQHLADALAAPIEIIPGAGHMIHYDAPERVARAIERVADIADEAMRAVPAGTQLARASAVIFDIDGTLVDSVDLHAQAWQEAFRHFGHEIDYGAIRSQIGKGGDQLMPVFLSQDELREKGEALENYRAALFKEKYLPRVTGFAAVRSLFERLRADGKRIVLASSAKKDELEVYEAIADIVDLVDAEVSADDVDRSKPHPDVYESALTKLGRIDAAQAIAIGDSPYDAEAAAKAGLETIGVRCGGFPETGLRHAGCSVIADDPAELLRQYEGAGSRR